MPDSCKTGFVIYFSMPGYGLMAALPGNRYAGL
jgi:hypothetical protein